MFALLQNLVYDLVGDTLVTARERRTEMVLELVQLRENNALIAATRPAVLRDLASPDAKTNPLSVVIDVRQVLLGASAGDLTSEQIIHHSPGIGKQSLRVSP